MVVCGWIIGTSHKGEGRHIQMSRLEAGWSQDESIMKQGDGIRYLGLHMPSMEKNAVFPLLVTDTVSLLLLVKV